MSGIDPNVWYHLSETRVDKANESFNNGLSNQAGGALGFNGVNDQAWQFQPVENAENTYFMRTNKNGPDEHMSTCYKPNEVHPGKTGICMAPANKKEPQQWVITAWDDGNGLKMVNVGNGTDYVLDVHPGNPPFMNDQIDDGSFPQPAQHWLIESVADVNDGAYSTVYDIEPAGATSSPKTTATGSSNAKATDTSGNAIGQESSSDSSGGSSLSAGATAGIGVGAALAVLALGAGVFFLLKRRKQKKPWTQDDKSSNWPSDGGYSHPGHSHGEYPNNGTYANSNYPNSAYPHSSTSPRPTYGSPVYSNTTPGPTEADEGKPNTLHEAPETGRDRIELP